jgi:hypothetical protein
MKPINQGPSLDQVKRIIDHNKISDYSFDDILLQVKQNKNRIIFFGKIFGQNVTVRCCVKRSAEEVKKILNEASVLSILAKKKCNFQPKLFAYDTGEHPWLIKSYLKGKIAGKLLSFEKDFVDHISPDKVINAIKKYKLFYPKLSWDYKDLATNYSRNLGFIDEYLPNKFEGRNNWLKYFNQFIMPLKCKKYLSHNDLNAGNVLCDDNSNFRIIDWESVGFDTYQKDFANVFHMAFGYPDWQSKFIKIMNFTKAERAEFDAWGIYLLLFNSMGLKKTKIKGSKNYFRSGNLTNKEIEEYIEGSLARAKDLSKHFVHF